MESLSHLIPAFGRAMEGQRVVWVGETHEDAVREFRRLLSIVPRECEVRFTNGDESITAPNGGYLKFMSMRSMAIRGRVVDRAYVPHDIPEQCLLNILPAIQTSPGGEIIDY